MSGPKKNRRPDLRVDMLASPTPIVMHDYARVAKANATLALLRMRESMGGPGSPGGVGGSSGYESGGWTAAPGMRAVQSARGPGGKVRGMPSMQVGQRAGLGGSAVDGMHYFVGPSSAPAAGGSLAASVRALPVSLFIQSGTSHPFASGGFPFEIERGSSEEDDDVDDDMSAFGGGDSVNSGSSSENVGAAATATASSSSSSSIPPTIVPLASHGGGAGLVARLAQLHYAVVGGEPGPVEPITSQLRFLEITIMGSTLEQLSAAERVARLEAVVWAAS